MKKEYYKNCWRFCTPFLAAANTVAGDTFCNFFLHILIDNFCNYKRCKFHKGF